MKCHHGGVLYLTGTHQCISSHLLDSCSRSSGLASEFQTSSLSTSRLVMTLALRHGGSTGLRVGKEIMVGTECDERAALLVKNRAAVMEEPNAVITTASAAVVPVPAIPTHIPHHHRMKTRATEVGEHHRAIAISSVSTMTILAMTTVHAPLLPRPMLVVLAQTHGKVKVKEKEKVKDMMWRRVVCIGREGLMMGSPPHSRHRQEKLAATMSHRRKAAAVTRPLERCLLGHHCASYGHRRHQRDLLLR